MNNNICHNIRQNKKDQTRKAEVAIIQWSTSVLSVNDKDEEEHLQWPRAEPRNEITVSSRKPQVSV